jgi:regulator of protease activity HflC (stomatin/prohibitin superfamily)
MAKELLGNQSFEEGRSRWGTLRPNPLSTALFVLLTLAGVAAVLVLKNPPLGALFLFLAVVTLLSMKIASQWERAIILRLGKYRKMKGPGLFLIMPFMDTIPYWIDLRVIATAFKAEQTLTCDNVPVDVDAVCFWRVIDAQKAALEVANYYEVISWASQTALRDVIGKTELSEMLVGREKIDVQIRELIDKRIEEWGIHVQSVEIRDVVIPGALQDAMSIQAQAERERQARVILGESEMQIAEKFAQASKSYVNNPTALHLRAMNMLYEGLKEKGALMIVPSTAIETMGLGAIVGLTALQKIALQEDGKTVL